MFRSIKRDIRRTSSPETVLYLCVFVLAMGLPCKTGLANDGDIEARCQNSVWEVSARSASYSICDACKPCQLATAKYEYGSWIASSEDLLLEDLRQNQLPRTIFYIHGNRMSSQEARGRALFLFRLLCCRSEQPVRLILFNWPSEKPNLLLPKRIAEDKKETLDLSSFYLAGLLGRVPAEEVESIVGFSFGCAIASGALHLQAGGSLCGQLLPEDCHHVTNPVRLGFIAPAFDRNALTQCGEYNQAMNLVEVLVNLYNSSDPVLKRFRFFDRLNPDAAGVFGLASSQHQPLASYGCIVQYDCCSLGHTHAEKDYYCCSKVDMLLDNALGKSIER